MTAGASCPTCHRPVAVARPTCLYCGAALPAETVAALGGEIPGATPLPVPGLPGRFGLAARPTPVPSAPRLLLVVDLSGLSGEAIARTLGLPAFEAGLRARAGGFHLHLAGEEEQVKPEAARLEGEGLRVVALPEAEARTPPVVASGGECSGGKLRLRSAGRTLEVAGEELLLVVEGPIQREYQSRPVERRKWQTATLDPSHRFHLHRRSDTRPVELDPGNFAFGSRGTVAGSSLLEIKTWIGEVAAQVKVDDGFRRLPPALSPAAPEEGAAASFRGAGPGLARSKEAPEILDNVAQFRFYSGWRAAVERRL